MNTPPRSAAWIRLSLSLPMSTGLSLTYTMAIDSSRFLLPLLLQLRLEIRLRQLVEGAVPPHDVAGAEAQILVLIGHDAVGRQLLVGDDDVVTGVNQLDQLRIVLLDVVLKILDGLGRAAKIIEVKVVVLGDLPHLVLPVDEVNLLLDLGH